MSKVTFIGTGAWASGLATVLTKNNHKVVMWGIDDKEISDINKGKNTKYFGDKFFNNPENLKATTDLKKALKGTQYLVLAVPSSAFEIVIPQIKNVLQDKKINVINVAKGIDNKSKLFYSDVIKKEFGENLKNYCTVVGPSYAVEVFDNQLTVINVVGPKSSYLQAVASIFNNDTFKLIENKNEYGAQLFAALKNTLAIAMGIVRETKPYKNPEAALLTIGVKEINNILKYLYPKSDKLIGFEFAGIGDLFLTCTSEKSRNFSFGLLIAQKGVKKALEKNSKTIEGYRTAKIFYEMLKNVEELRIPFFRSIFNVLFANKSEKDLLDFLTEF